MKNRFFILLCCLVCGLECLAQGTGGKLQSMDSSKMPKIGSTRQLSEFNGAGNATIGQMYLTDLSKEIIASKLAQKEGRSRRANTSQESIATTFAATSAETLDIEITDMTLPLPNSSLGDSETLSITLANNGTSNITQFDLLLEVQLNGTQVLSETIPGISLIIAAGASAEYLTTLDLSTEGVYVVYATASNVTNANGDTETTSDNNSSMATTTHFETTTAPFSVDFTQGEQSEQWASDGSWVYDDEYYYSMVCLGYSPLLSRGVALEAGKSYRISYNYMAGFYYYSYTVYEGYQVLCGLDGSSTSDMQTIGGEDYAFTNTAFTDGEAVFNCTESGTYQFAFLQEAPQGSFFIKTISITELASYDLAITGMQATPTMLPEPQTSLVTTKLQVENRGTKTSNATITATLDGNTVLSTTTVENLAGLETRTVTVEYSLASVPAGSTASVEFSIADTSGEEDANPDDNTASFNVQITDQVLAYDSSPTYDYAIGGSYEVVVGVPFTLSVDDVLTGISVGWGYADGQDISLLVYKVNLDDEATMADGTIYYPLGDLIYSATTPQGTQKGQITYDITPRQLKAGESYMICVGYTGYCLAIDYVNPGQLYLMYDEDYAVDQSSAGYGTAAIRAVFGDATAPAYNLTVNEIVSPDGEGVYTSNQPIVVSVTNNGTQTAAGTLQVTVNGTDLNAQTVTLESYTTSTYTFTADLSTPGDYIIVATATLEGDEDTSDNSVQKTVTSAEMLDAYTLDFESCTDFSTEGFNPAWTTIDGDATMAWEPDFCWDYDIYFPFEEGASYGFMVFNPYTTEPALTTYMPNAAPHGGERYGVTFASQYTSNDDWLISPQLIMPEDGASMTMYVQSLTNSYGLEQYEVCVSTTDNQTSSFTVVNSGTAPYGTWTEVTTDLSAYNGQSIFVAIHCVSNEAEMFMVDDITITNPNSKASNGLALSTLTLYPNPASEVIVISASGQTIKGVAFYSTSGTKIATAPASYGEVRYNVSGFTPGIYFAKVETETGTQVLKFIKK